MMARVLPLMVKDRSGSAAAEMALVLPLLLVLVFTMLEGAHYMYVEHQIVKGVRDGARYAARLPFGKYPSCGIDASVVDTIKEVTRTGQLSGGTARVSGWTNAEVTVTANCPATAVTTGIYAGLGNAPRVTVKAVVDYAPLIAPVSLMTSLKVAAQQQAAVMGL